MHTFLPDAAPTLDFLVPRTFFILFLRSLRCLRVAFCFSKSPCLKKKQLHLRNYTLYDTVLWGTI